MFEYYDIIILGGYIYLIYECLLYKCVVDLDLWLLGVLRGYVISGSLRI